MCHTGDAMDAVVVVVAPSLGLVTANLLYLSPLRDVRARVAKGELADLAVIPLAMLAVNGFAWCVYSTVMADATILSAFLVFFSNLPGALLCMYYGTVVLPLPDLSRRQLLGMRLVFAVGMSATFLSLLASQVACRDICSPETRSWIVGYVVIAIYMATTVSPLLSLVRVLKTRNAASFSAPLAATMLVNGALWTVFGFYIDNIVIWGPNAFSVLNSVVQLVCLALLPSVPRTCTSVAGVPPDMSAPSAQGFH